MLKVCAILLLISVTLFSSAVVSQEIKTFDITDFDLSGNVKSCLVITNYGKEEYYFDATGQLSKSVTRFNDFDYETTYYKYQNKDLLEKRVESYRNKTFDKATSIAHFYEIDSSTARKITEKIISYTKRLLEQNVYQYNRKGQLTKLTRTDANGTDEIMIDYDSIDGKYTMTKTLNQELLEMTHSWSEKSDTGELLSLKSIVKYVDGKRDTKVDEVYNGESKLIIKADSLFDISTEKWIAQNRIKYTYSEDGVLSKTEIGILDLKVAKAYTYQFDGTANNNWVKEIITPDNTYITRRIEYYELPILAKE